MRVPLSLACGAYDRTATLARGDIRPEGVDLTFLALPVEETFFRMTRHREFDAAEMSLSSYLISLDQGAPFVAIPAFVSRAFRHNGIYVGAASGVSHPAGLAGGVVGVAEYQLTANETLRTFVRYSFEQGLVSREREPAELFAPETREAYVI